MTGKAQALADRHESLLQTSAAQRDDLALQLGAVNVGVGRIDDGLEVVRRWISSPWIVGVALTLVLALGRSRSLKTVGAGLGLLGTVLRMGRFVDRKNRRELPDGRE